MAGLSYWLDRVANDPKRTSRILLEPPFAHGAASLIDAMPTRRRCSLFGQAGEAQAFYHPFSILRAAIREVLSDVRDT